MDESVFLWTPRYYADSILMIRANDLSIFNEAHVQRRQCQYITKSTCTSQLQPPTLQAAHVRVAADRHVRNEL
jgi:hypothetical protein